MNRLDKIIRVLMRTVAVVPNERSAHARGMLSVLRPLKAYRDKWLALADAEAHDSVLRDLAMRVAEGIDTLPIEGIDD